MFVPLQNYKEEWWNKDIDTIDEKLFEKYNIPDDIKSFVYGNIQHRSEENIVNYNNEV